MRNGGRTIDPPLTSNLWNLSKSTHFPSKLLNLHRIACVGAVILLLKRNINTQRNKLLSRIEAKQRQPWHKTQDTNQKKSHVKAGASGLRFLSLGGWLHTLSKGIPVLLWRIRSWQACERIPFDRLLYPSVWLRHGLRAALGRLFHSPIWWKNDLYDIALKELWKTSERASDLP